MVNRSIKKWITQTVAQIRVPHNKNLKKRTPRSLFGSAFSFLKKKRTPQGALGKHQDTIRNCISYGIVRNVFLWGTRKVEILLGALAKRASECPIRNGVVWVSYGNLSAKPQNKRIRRDFRVHHRQENQSAFLWDQNRVFGHSEQPCVRACATTYVRARAPIYRAILFHVGNFNRQFYIAYSVR